MAANPKEAIARMSYTEIARCMDWVLHADQEVWKAPMWVWSALTQRLYEIALYENHVLSEHRKDTLERLAAVKALVEERYKDEPEVVMRYREANRSIGEEFRRLGVGSLAWQVQELGISGDDDLLRFISRPENAPLLQDYLSTLGPELASQFRAAMARQTQAKND